jgi:hypothetical protein
MNMIAGCMYAATANNARTSFSPSPNFNAHTHSKFTKSPNCGCISNSTLTYLDVRLAALMLKNLQFASFATALALFCQVKLEPYEPFKIDTLRLVGI